MFHVKQILIMPKIFTSKKQKIGELGENIAKRFLVKQGFSILERNYTKKWGEIDIVAEKKGKIHFVEVKSMSISPFEIVSHETLENYRPEENMHPWKMKRLARAIQTYILSRKLEEKEWQVDLLAVFLDLENKSSRVRVVKNVIL